ncbi:hypothetical protein MA16_Dca012264 [Dendrobium catenatum]|uniref:Uncharacterized protein n=1 Tax=Dendrobium catenatum TaxID=906689 RepID=A0A2I0WR53_9ASPA|nr:hypothetical protein MA16_Dca012264 [Dendrobium catenatum]
MKKQTDWEKSEERKTSRRSPDTSNRTICKKSQSNSSIEDGNCSRIWGKDRKKKPIRTNEGKKAFVRSSVTSKYGANTE